jgi:hypothetical protein
MTGRREGLTNGFSPDTRTIRTSFVIEKNDYAFTASLATHHDPPF